MKKLLIFLAVVCVVSLGSVINTHAANTMVKSGFTTYDVKKLIGTEVRNPEGVKLGVIKDLVLDSQGRDMFAIVFDHAVVEYGGMHTEDKYIAVPFEVLSFSRLEGHRIALLDLPKKNFDYAPSYHRADLKNPVWDEGMYRFYGETPYWNEQMPTNVNR